MFKSKNFNILLIIWCIYILYLLVQYNDNLKKTDIFIFISMFYTIFGNLLWIYRSRQLDANETLKLALIWDSGINLLSFLIPILLFGKHIETKVLCGMFLIFCGISLLVFGDKIFNKVEQI